MARERNNTKPAEETSGTVRYEAELWQMADALRGSVDAAEYKHVVLGLIFLTYFSDASEEHHAKLVAEQAQGADSEDPDDPHSAGTGAGALGRMGAGGMTTVALHEATP